MPSSRALNVPPARPGVSPSTDHVAAAADEAAGRAVRRVARVRDEPVRVAGLAGLAVGAPAAVDRRAAVLRVERLLRGLRLRVLVARHVHRVRATRSVPSEFSWLGVDELREDALGSCRPATTADWCVPSGLKK